jgi:hypothetical protein
MQADNESDDHQSPNAEILAAYREAWGASSADAEAEAGLRTSVDRMAADVDRIATERVPGVTAHVIESISKEAQ